MAKQETTTKSVKKTGNQGSIPAAKLPAQNRQAGDPQEDKSQGENSSDKKAKKEEKIGMVTRREYDQLKRRAIKFEAKNRSYILLIPCDGNKNWCEMGERSALFYKYLVCEPMGVPVSLADDFDSFYTQFEIGRIRTRGYSVVRKRLMKAGVYGGELLKDRCMIFQLKESVTEDEAERLRRMELERQAKLNAVVQVQFVDPALYTPLIDTAAVLHRICFRRMDKLSSVTNGRRMTVMIDNVIRLYYDLTMLKMTDEQKTRTWKQMQENVRELLVELQIVAGLKLWSRESCAAIGEKVIELSKRIERNLKDGAKKHKARNRKNEGEGSATVAVGGIDRSVYGCEEGQAQDV